MSVIYGMFGDGDAGRLSQMGLSLRHHGEVVREWSPARAVRFGQRLHEAAISQLAVENLGLVADADLYNVSDIRDLLKSRGRTFLTDRDDEVVLQGYAEFGPKICEYINGSFTFALWDAMRSTVILARDRFGSRSLFYWKREGFLAFASEYKALLALPEIPAEVDRDAVQYLQYTKKSPPHRTLIRGISSVPAGHFIEFTSDVSRGQRYWNMELDLRPSSKSEHAQILRERFLSAVTRQLRGLEMVGVALSGGVDSAAIVAAVRKVRPDIRLHTFTTGYGPDDSDILSAAHVADAIGTVHHEVFLPPERIHQVLPETLWHLEDPVSRSETVLYFETGRLAAENVGVVLTGYWADTLYAGMPRHKIIKLIQVFPWARTGLEEFYNYTQSSTPPTSLAGRTLKSFFYRGSDFPPPMIRGAALPERPKPFPKMRAELLNRFEMDALLGGPELGYARAGRLYLAHGLKIRSPYTDLDLFQHAFQISDRLKIRGWREKHIFREAMIPLLPPAALNRPKNPQTMKYDLAFSEALDRIAEDVLTPEAVRSRGFFELFDIERMRRRPSNRAYSPEQSLRLWTAVITELWAQMFIDRRGRPLEHQSLALGARN